MPYERSMVVRGRRNIEDDNYRKAVSFLSIWYRLCLLGGTDRRSLQHIILRLIIYICLLGAYHRYKRSAFAEPVWEQSCGQNFSLKTLPWLSSGISQWVWGQLTDEIYPSKTHGFTKLRSNSGMGESSSAVLNFFFYRAISRAKQRIQAYMLLTDFLLTPYQY